MWRAKTCQVHKMRQMAMSRLVNVVTLTFRLLTVRPLTNRGHYSLVTFQYITGQFYHFEYLPIKIKAKSKNIKNIMNSFLKALYFTTISTYHFH